MRSRWFYAAWALAVLLALVLPVAIPYALWRGDDSTCARHATDALADGDYFGARRLPLSIDVRECISINDDLTLRAEVTVRGAYGIPIESYAVTADSVETLGTRANAFTSAIAVLAGAFVVSMPFALVAVYGVLVKQGGPR